MASETKSKGFLIHTSKILIPTCSISTSWTKWPGSSITFAKYSTRQILFWIQDIGEANIKTSSISQLRCIGVRIFSEVLETELWSLCCNILANINQEKSELPVQCENTNSQFLMSITPQFNQLQWRNDQKVWQEEMSAENLLPSLHLKKQEWRLY